MSADTIKFEIGRTYECRSACDYNCVWAFTVTRRTAKFITILDERGEESRVGVSVWEGVERALPLGRFAFAPVIMADREEV